MNSCFAEVRDLLKPSSALAPAPWHSLMQGGDWMLLLTSVVAVIASYPLFWNSGAADRAIIKRDGQVVAELALNRTHTYAVNGPLGNTIVEIQSGRARIQSDPGPRQYCVQQGWLTRPNAVAICAPNHITLQLSGPRGPSDHAGNYDSLSY